MTAINKDFRVKNGIVAGGSVTATTFIGDGSQLTGITGGGNTSTPQRLYFVGDGTTATFNLGVNVVLPLAPVVYVGGILQDPVTHYNINVSAKTITFTSAIPSGADVVVMYGMINDLGTPTDHTVTFQKLAPSNFTYSTYTGDGSTVNYTLAQSTQTPEQLFVYVANVPQTPATAYTVSGTTLTFSAAPPAGSNIVVRYYGTPLPYQTNVDWNATSGSAEILNKPVLFSGSYVDLTNKPTLFSGVYSDLSGKPTLFSGSYVDLTNKPTLFSGSYTDLTNQPTIPSLTGYATETYVNTQVANIVNSAPAALDTLNELATALGNDSNFATTVSTQLGLKANTSSLATVATSGSYNDLLNKPSLSVLSSVDSLHFNTSYSGGTAAGQLSWNSSDGTLDVGMQSGVVLQVGQETHYVVRNETGSTIQNGTSVYCGGVTAGSGRMTISKMIGDGSIDTVQYLGLATHDINTGVNGIVTFFGYVRGLDTRGTSNSALSVGDETWDIGDKLYVHPTVAGKLTKIEPQAPNTKICVAVIIVRHQSSGVVFVRPTTNLKLNKLSDVQLTNSANNDVLKYDSATGAWKNAQLSSSNVTTALGFTPYNSTNPNGYISSITSGNVTTALGYTPYNSTNPNGYISSITSSNVTTALGYTPATAAQVQAANDNAVAMAIALG